MTASAGIAEFVESRMHGTQDAFGLADGGGGIVKINAALHFFASQSILVMTRIPARFI